MNPTTRQSREPPTQFAQELFDGLPARYDLLADVLSFGQNHRWRAAMVDVVAARRPARVLDVATGTAGVALLLADRCDASITGVDLTAQMLRRGQASIAGRGLEHRIRLAQASGDALPFADRSFDALTFSYLLRYVPDPAATIAELARVLEPGGVLANLEFLVPQRAAWRLPWLAYTRALLPAGGLLTGGKEWYEVGRFLGPSISEHYRKYPIDWTVAAWQRAGLGDVTVRRMSLGGGLVMWGTKRS